MAPLSGKQQREYLKFQNKEAREEAKMGLDEMRKQQLHQIKLQEAAAKANQGLGHKEQVNNAKLKDMGIPAPRMNKQKLGIPTQNPLAGTGMFKQGQRSLPQSPIFKAQGTDTVPAMLTPGEAVIPAPAAQNPKNKKAIKRMVQEGRKANRLRDGAVNVANSDAPAQARYHAQGTQMVVPSLAYEHPDVPGSSFMNGTMSVPDFKRGSSAQANYANGTYGVVPQQVQSAVGYFNGTEWAGSDLNIPDLTSENQWLTPQIDRSNDILVASNNPAMTQELIELNKRKEADRIAQQQQRAIEYKSALANAPVAKPVVGFNRMGNVAPVVPIESYIPPVVSETKVNEKPKVTPGPPGINLTSVIKPLSSIDDIDTYSLFVNAESGGSSRAKNPLSSASGLVQFTEGTWEGDAKKGTGIRNQVPELANVKFGSPEFYDEKSQKIAFNHLNKQNEAVLTKNKIPVSNLTRYGMWQLGADNGPKVLSNPKASFKDSLTNADDVLKANPQFAGFKTNQDYINWAENYLNKKAGTGAGAGRGQTLPEVVTGSTQPNVAPNAVPQQSVAVPEKVLEIPPVEGAGSFQKQNQDRFNMLGFESKKELDNISEEVKRVTQMQGTPEEKKGFLAKSLENIFGPKGLFSDKELVRFGILAAGGMLTGGSVGGSLRVAGLNTLQAADRRQAEEAAAIKQQKQLDAYDARQQKQLTQARELNTINQATIAANNLRKDQQSLYSNLIKSAVETGQITPEVAGQLYRANFAGKFSDIEGVLNDYQKFATPQYQAGLKPTDKPATFIQEGYTTPQEMYRDPKDPNSLIVISRNPEGKPAISRVPAKGYREVTSTEDTVSAKERQFKDTLLSSSLFGVDEKKNKGVYFDLSKQDAISQLKTWQNQQRKLNLQDDYTQYAEQINHALDIAAKTGERKPHVGKMLDLLVLNSTALTNNDIIIDSSTKKMIEPGKLGKLTDDVKIFNEKKLGKEANDKKVLSASNAFITKASEGYNAPGDKLSQLQLAEKVGRSNPMFNKIKEAPNPYWGYVYYQMAIDKPKKE
jgi:hypothetical protein